ncbi:MAG TPA: M1 family aminopeptidase [Dehalococcoidia bacterium]
MNGLRFCGRALAADRRPFALPGDEPRYAPDRDFDTRHVRIEITKLDLPERRFSAVCANTLVPINDGLATVRLDAGEMEIQAVTLADGTPLRFEHSGETLTVHLDRPRNAGEEVTVVARYSARPRHGLYITGPDEGYPDKPWQVWTQGQDEDSHYWFPCHDYPNEKATSEVLATVPASWRTVSNGVLLSERDNGDGTKTVHWRQETPHSIYLITFAAGEFFEVREEADGVPVLYYGQVGREEDARRGMGRTPEMIRHFSRLLDYPFPYPKYAQVCVQDFIFGGMENTSATTMTDRLLYDERARPDVEQAMDGLVSHELAHQWFGDLITCRDWANAWLNEGFATYFEVLWTEHHRGLDDARYELYQNAEIYLGEDSGRYRRPVVYRVYREPIDIFDRHLYEKGSLVLHMLRYVLGDDRFFKAIRHYLKSNAGGTVVTGDLERAVEEATGRSLGWFFDQWIHKGGHPDLKVEYAWDEEAKTARFKVTQTQQEDENTAAVYRMPVELAFTLPSGEERRVRVHLSEREQAFFVPLPEKPVLARFDPGNALLKTVDLSLPEEMLYHALRHDDDVTGRIRAAKTIAKKGGLKAVEALRQTVLEDPFWGVRVEAAKALGSLKTPGARDALIACLGVAEPRVRRAVVQALGEFKGDEAAAGPLLERLERDESYYVAGEAAKALGRIRAARAREALTAALDRDSYADVIRTLALEGLGELKDPETLPLLREWTRYGRPQRAREAAARALGKLGDVVKDRDELREHVESLLDDPWLMVRLSAIGALAELKDPKSIPALQRVAERDPDGRAVRRAREAVREIREGQERKEEVRTLREDLDKALRENRELRERIEKLEARLSGGS